MTTPLDQIKSWITEKRGIAERATPGKWVTERFDSDNGYIHFSVNDSEMRQVAFCHEDMHPKTYRADSTFISDSRTTIPQCLAVIEVLSKALEECSTQEKNHEATYHACVAKNALAEAAKILGKK